MKLKDCTKCDGYGWVEGFKIASTPNGLEEIPTRDECEVCNGSGEISEEEK